MPELSPDEPAADAAATVAPSASASFRCAQCGAQLAWDPDADALTCEHCGAHVAVERGSATIVERPLSEAGAAARGLGLSTRVARCKNCGATVSFADAATSTACVFCGSPQVLEQSENRNRLRPESLIPLDVGRATVEKQFKAWLKRLWFRPSALARTQLDAANGVYVPCWTFDCNVHSQWSALAGYYYYVTETRTAIVNGRPVLQTHQVRKVRWVPANGARDDSFDDLQVHASQGLSEKLASELGAFDTKALVPYRPEYLAGWRAEEYAVDLESGWQSAQQRVSAEQERRCAADVPGDTHASLRVQNVVSGVRWKHVLLPLWSLTYRWQGKTYAVLIHGQTGRVAGDAPLSWLKICGAVVCGVLLVAFVLLVLALTRG